jgi:hypothetical protein
VADAHRPPDHDDQLIEDEREAEGEQELIVVPGGVEAAHARVLDEQAEDRDTQRGNQQSEPEIAQRCRDRDQKIRAHGEQRAVGEVGDIEHARDERQAEAHQGVQHPGGDPVEDLPE